MTQEVATATEVKQPEEDEFSEEFDELKERQDRRMPIIHSYADEHTQFQYAQKFGVRIKARPTIQNVIKTREFRIVDMHVKDSSDQAIIGSFAIYYIEPHKQIVPMEIESIAGVKVKKNLWYEILDGKGLLCIENYTESVIKGDLLLVEQDVKHNFFNTGEQHLVIKMLYDGHLDLRDRYTPTAKVSKESKESKEKFFNVQTQQEEEKKATTSANKKKTEIPVPTINEPKIKRFEVKQQTVSSNNKVEKEKQNNVKSKSDEKFL